MVDCELFIITKIYIYIYIYIYIWYLSLIIIVNYPDHAAVLVRVYYVNGMPYSQSQNRGVLINHAYIKFDVGID